MLKSVSFYYSFSCVLYSRQQVWRRSMLRRPLADVGPGHRRRDDRRQGAARRKRGHREDDTETAKSRWR